MRKAAATFTLLLAACASEDGISGYEAFERQVEGARMGLAHVVGLGTCSAVHILEKA